jgi:hypothetical protein
MHYKNSYQCDRSDAEGYGAEDSFKALAAQNGWKFIRYATPDEDRLDHWDQLWGIGSRPARIEIKAPKRSRRADHRASDLRTVIELQGIAGFPGWLYAKADMVALGRGDSFLVYDILTLRKFVESIIINKDSSVTKQPSEVIPSYIVYNRASRVRERCVFVDWCDLEKVRHVELHQ